jgi:hypothetical protein
MRKHTFKMSWQYIAGFVDGEGSIVRTRPTVYRILIPQTHEGVLKEIQRFAGCGFIYQCKTRKSHWKDNWVYAVARQKDVLFFLQKIQPYLIVKKDLAQTRIPTLKILVKRLERKRADLQKRLKLCKFLRSRGWTYRAIAKKLNVDFGYARRLFLYAQDGVWIN